MAMQHALIAAVMGTLSLVASATEAEFKLDPADVKVLTEAGLDFKDSKALLGYFHSRTLSDADRAKIEMLIEQLGDDDFLVRDQATQELRTLGRNAVPMLR